MKEESCLVWFWVGLFEALLCWWLAWLVRELVRRSDAELCYWVCIVNLFPIVWQPPLGHKTSLYRQISLVASRHCLCVCFITPAVIAHRHTFPCPWINLSWNSNVVRAASRNTWWQRWNTRPGQVAASHKCCTAPMSHLRGQTAVSVKSSLCLIKTECSSVWRIVFSSDHWQVHCTGQRVIEN